ncbi:SOS response-associated peptidase [Pseudomonas sp. ML96]|uniref:SOS response-associated peptidase n=1 Tax=Pseudomonas sp. ML96 TaxID=1523503 RepID=UPI0005BD0EA2|nr:SOS response-associated peptidase family protein [Pseudomonas sp. ML96]
MCGRFVQRQSLAAYLNELDSEEEVIAGWEDTPLERYNVAPSTQVQLLHSTAGGLIAAPVRWGWMPHWAKGKMPPPINARVEKVAEGKYFRQIWPHRALVAADGWYEWVKDEADPKRKQPFFIRLRDGAPCFFAAIGQFPEDGSEPREGDGFVIITADAEGGMVDVHDRRPVVLSPELAREWLDPATTLQRAEQMLLHQGRPAADFEWFKVDKAVGNVKNQGPQLILPQPFSNDS